MRNRYPADSPFDWQLDAHLSGDDEHAREPFDWQADRGLHFPDLFDWALELGGVRSRRPLGPARLVVTLLALGIATAGVFAGSFAAWTAGTNNPGNAVTAGTLTMSNSKNAAAVFTASNIKPGDTGSSTVIIQNTGSVPMTTSITQDTVSSSGIEANLRMSIHDDTRNYCYWPTQSAGACGGYGTWDGSATLTGLALPATGGGAQWPASESHTFTVSWQLLSSSSNADQGKTGSFRLVWNGTS
jgi:hypothetical protein